MTEEEFLNWREKEIDLEMFGGKKKQKRRGKWRNDEEDD